MAARVTRTKPAEPSAEPDADGVPEFTTAGPDGARVGPVLFRIDGTAYPMRGDGSFAASLRYLRSLSTRNVREAEFQLLEHVVGAAALDALLASNPSREQWAGVVQRATKHMLGTLEPEPETEGN